ncbi:hypothetical protein DUI87_10522 [Hirundo rustica rustica]|uniref:Uncharacterized protein n=1 Tax=Hirundo rustica rustica TaxID=333673 RepID=A0A3M0KIU7_HIRRU|nr:hypothetical protein DUI87_10522 [Hirundo rustica rustica]
MASLGGQKISGIPERGQKQQAPQMGQKQLAPQMGQKPQASLVRQPQASLDARHLASLKEKNKTSAATSKLSEDQSQTKTTPEKKHLSGQEEEQLVFNSSQTTVFQRALEPVTLRSAGSDQDTLRRNGHSCSKPFGFGETVGFRTHTMGSNISQEKISRQKKDRIAARFVTAAGRIKLEVITENSSEKQDSRALSVGQGVPGDRGMLSSRSVAPPGYGGGGNSHAFQDSSENSSKTPKLIPGKGKLLIHPKEQGN